MALILNKLRCGVIYTDDFSDYLAGVHAEQAEDNPYRILTLEYLRCASGTLKGKAWWQLLWIPVDAAPDYRCFHMGGTPVHIPRAAQHGLRERCLSYENGRVIVIP
jgi:hypothetical protein